MTYPSQSVVRISFPPFREQMTFASLYSRSLPFTQNPVLGRAVNGFMTATSKPRILALLSRTADLALSLYLRPPQFRRNSGVASKSSLRCRELGALLYKHSQFVRDRRKAISANEFSPFRLSNWIIRRNRTEKLGFEPFTELAISGSGSNGSLGLSQSTVPSVSVFIDLRLGASATNL